MLTKNDLQQIKQAVHEELKEVREDIKTVDMKVELVNSKVDKLHEDTNDGFGRIFDGIEQNEVEQKKNIRKIKEFIGMTS